MAARDVALAYLAAFATGDPDAIAAHVTEGFVNDHTAALGSGCVGKDEYRRRLPGFLVAFPELRYEAEDVVAEGGKVFVAYRMTATNEGRPIALRGAMRFHVEDGRIALRTDYWDSLVFQQQAGLV